MRWRQTKQCPRFLNIPAHLARNTSDSNALGSGLREARDGGLTAFGRRAVERMNRLGMAIDVSHSSGRTGLDVCEVSEEPVFVTHAGARAVWDTSRMKTDGLLRAVAATGGVFGMSAAPHHDLTAASWG